MSELETALQKFDYAKQWKEHYEQQAAVERYGPHKAVLFEQARKAADTMNTLSLQIETLSANLAQHQQGLAQHGQLMVQSTQATAALYQEIRGLRQQIESSQQQQAISPYDQRYEETQYLAPYSKEYLAPWPEEKLPPAHRRGSAMVRTSGSIYVAGNLEVKVDQSRHYTEKPSHPYQQAKSSDPMESGSFWISAAVVGVASTLIISGVAGGR